MVLDVLTQVCSGVIQLTTGLALRQPANRRRGKSSAIQGRLGKFERMTVYIAANYTHDIDVAQVAEVAGMHPNSTMRLFSPNLRLDRARIPDDAPYLARTAPPFDQQAEGPGHRSGQRVQFTEPFLRRL